MSANGTNGNGRHPEGPHKGEWLPGHSGNPGGITKEVKLTEIRYHRIARSKLTEEKWIAIVEKAIADAIEGDRFAREFCATLVLGDLAKLKPETDESLEQRRRSILGIIADPAKVKLLTALAGALPRERSDEPGGSTPLAPPSSEPPAAPSST